MGKSIDLTILKKDAILIVELNSESQGFRATENLWPVDNKRNVGGNYSPFSQIREYRNKWRDLLKQSGRELNCLRALPDVEFNRASGGSVCGH